MGRYAFSNQVSILQWNLARLAESILPLIHSDTKQAIILAENVLKTFPKFKDLLAALQHPYKDSKYLKAYQALPSDDFEQSYQTFCGT